MSNANKKELKGITGRFNLKFILTLLCFIVMAFSVSAQSVDSLNALQVSATKFNGLGEDVFVLDNIAYIASADVGVNIYDVSNPINPVQLCTYNPSLGGNLGAFPLNLHVENFYYEYEGEIIKETYLYLADYKAGFVVLDVTDPSNPIDTFRDFDAASAKCVLVKDNYVYRRNNREFSHI